MSAWSTTTRLTKWEANRESTCDLGDDHPAYVVRWYGLPFFRDPESLIECDPDFIADYKYQRFQDLVQLGFDQLSLSSMSEVFYTGWNKVRFAQLDKRCRWIQHTFWLRCEPFVRVPWEDDRLSQSYEGNNTQSTVALS